MKDLTPEQRKERQKKIKARKWQTEDKPPASSMDVRAVTPPIKQFAFSDLVPAVAEMTLTILPPSPTETEQPTHRSIS